VISLEIAEITAIPTLQTRISGGLKRVRPGADFRTMAPRLHAALYAAKEAGRNRVEAS